MCARSTHPPKTTSHPATASRRRTARALRAADSCRPPCSSHPSTDSRPESTSDVELDISNVDPGRTSRARSEALEAPVNERELASSSSVAATPVLAVARDDESRSEPPAETRDRYRVCLRVRDRFANPELELAQAPAPPAPSAQPPSAIPPAPPLNRTPPPPPLNDEKPAAQARPAGGADRSARSGRGETRSTAGDAAPASPRFACRRGSSDFGVPGPAQRRLRRPLLQCPRSRLRLRRRPLVSDSSQRPASRSTPRRRRWPLRGRAAGS